MTLSPDTNDPRRNLAALRWDAAWIDPALRRMAEAAAQRAGIGVESWIERAIRERCGMPEARYPAAEPAMPVPADFSAALDNAGRDAGRQRQSPQFRALSGNTPRPEARRPAEDEPLALTELVDRVPDRLPRRPPTPQPQPQPQQRGMSVFWAAGIAAVLAFIAVMAVRDPSLLEGRFLTADNQADRVAPPATFADNDSAPLHVRTAKRTDSNTRVAILPPLSAIPKPPGDVGAPAAPRVADLSPPPVAMPPATVAARPAAAGMVAEIPPPPSVTVPEASEPPAQTAAAPPVVVQSTPAAVAAAPVTPTKATQTQEPVQMAALPSPESALAPATPTVAAAPKPAALSLPPMTTPPASVPSSVSVQSLPPVEATPPAPRPAAPAPAAAASAPQSVVNASPTQVAMAPGAAPAPPAAPAHQDGPAADAAADARLAAELDAKIKAGDHVAEYRLGILYALGKGVTRDYDHAAKLLRASAESGLPEAEYDYGVLCDKGLGVPRDAAEAARWYAKAAQKGNPPAALNLGYAYAEGLGVTRNLPEAARWFRHAADAGLINAQFNLAYMYEQGAGVAKSAIDAYAWYSVAAEKGDQGAQQALDRIAAKLTPRELQTAKSRVKMVKRSIRVQG